MKFSCFSVSLLLLTTSCLPAQNASVNEERFITIGGIEQWVTIKGDDRSSPVILFLHGGPGSTMSQFAYNIYNGWEQDFVLVHWDQRGAGKTFGRNAPKEIDEEYYKENPLTVVQMASDGIELTKYILEYLNKEKLILVGTSWGSVLGMEMILDSPEFFEAYIGHAQFVNFSRNIKDAYANVYALAKSGQDGISLEQLNRLGEPPYDNARDYGQLLRIVKHFEREHSVPAPESWWKIASSYDNAAASKARYEGDDYSFINFVGHEKLGIKSMVSTIDFDKVGLVIEVPVYLIQGEQDLLTSKTINKPYFDKISAPEKKYFLLPDAAHGFNQSVIDKQFEVVNYIVTSKTGKE
jgi:pimeloyl-ACP methyl ester carboxylesterase